MSETREAWVVWVNEDGTEGRGVQEPRHVCEAEATARRLASGADVQGTDAPVTRVLIRREDVRSPFVPTVTVQPWFGPVALVPPTKEDRREQERIDAAAARERAREAAIEKAKALGLGDADIAALRGEVAE